MVMAAVFIIIVSYHTISICQYARLSITGNSPPTSDLVFTLAFVRLYPTVGQLLPILHIVHLIFLLHLILDAQFLTLINH